VLLLERLLVKNYKFPPQNIVKLIEGGDQDRRPTRGNIEREFKRLIRDATEGDVVVIALSGHGSRQPDFLRPLADRKADGMSELFLPADTTGKWDKNNKRIEKAIIDFELRDWLTAIQNKGTFVWTIVDSCYSGTVTRGEVARRILPEELVPQDVLQKATVQANQRNRGAPAQRGAGERGPILIEKPEQMPNLVAIYATYPNEVTFEMRMPPGNVKGEVNGLLTYTLNYVLDNAKTPLTYRDLVDQIYAQYSAWGRVSPTPLVEGQRRNFEVLGQKEFTQRPILLSRGNGDTLKIDAGALHGLTEGSVLAVRPPAGKDDPDKVLGHVRIQGLRILDAEVVPSAFNGRPAPALASLPGGARCEPVVIDLGDLRLRVAVEVPVAAKSA
jgi:hypothetical protein